MNKDCFVSWSGGKDSCMALYKAMESGYNPKVLFTMFSKENGISSAHRLTEDVFKAQTDAIGIAHVVGEALFNDYEEVFVSNIRKFKEQGMNFGIFGDIDLESHRQWEESVCDKASMTAVLPLWLRKRRSIVEEFIDLGFKAKIIVVNTTMMDKKFIGRDLSYELIKELEAAGVDACGENGEFHTVVYDGPIFKKPVDLKFSKDIREFETKYSKYAEIKVEVQ